MKQLIFATLFALGVGAVTGQSIFKAFPGENGEAVFQWPVTQGSGYFWQTSTDLANWDYMPEIINGDDSMIERCVMVDPSPPALFARAIQVPVLFNELANYDSDGDGLSNLAELQTHSTDPLNADSDGDGFDDSYDVQFYDPLVVNDFNQNSDNDAYSDGEEYQRGFNPFSEYDGDETGGTLDVAQVASSLFTLRGRDGDDVLTLPADRFFSQVFGDEGNDEIIGQSPFGDNFFGGNGNDVLIAMTGFANLDGGDGNDELHSGEFGGNLKGGRGDDMIIAGTGIGRTHTIDAGPGDDIVEALQGSGQINLGDGNDVLTTGDNDDFIEVGGFGHNTLTTNGGSDTIIVGGSASATIFSGEGNDSINTGDGNDEVFSEAGNDNINVSNGDDIVSSGDGNDFISGGDQGTKTVNAGTGDDFVFLSSQGDVSLGPGNDTLELAGGIIRWQFGDGTDLVKSERQATTITFGEGITLTSLSFDLGEFNTSGAATIENGWLRFGLQRDLRVWIDHPSDETLSGWITVKEWVGNEDAWTFDFTAADAGVISGSSLPIPGRQGIDGTTGDDSLTGTTGNDVIFALEGDDDISGAEGDDLLVGGAGHNIFRWSWGHGYDYVFGSRDSAFFDQIILAEPIELSHVSLEAGIQSDRLESELDPNGWQEAPNGRDLRVVVTHPSDASLSGAIVIHNWNRNQTQWSISIGGSSEQLVEGALISTSAADTLSGTAQDDTIAGLGGKDILSGLGGQDQIIGGLGDDNLDGGSGDDQLSGGPGQDTLIGGIGNDLLDGGLGQDIYLIEANQGFDRIVESETESITDFRHNIIRFGAGIQASDLKVKFGSSFSPSITVGQQNVDGDFLWSIKIEGWDGRTQMDQGATQTRRWVFEFADGTVWEGFNLLRAGFTGNFVEQALPRIGGQYIEGTPSDDLALNGDTGPNTILGFEGNDQLFGLADDDILSGGPGDDLLSGGEGNDYFFGGPGNNIYDLGLNSGFDTINEKAVEGSFLNTIKLPAEALETGFRFLPRSQNGSLQPRLFEWTVDLGDEGWAVEIDPESFSAHGWRIDSGNGMTFAPFELLDSETEVIYAGSVDSVRKDIEKVGRKATLVITPSEVTFVRYSPRDPTLPGATVFSEEDEVYITEGEWENITQDVVLKLDSLSRKIIEAQISLSSDAFIEIIASSLVNKMPALVFTDGTRAAWNPNTHAYELSREFDELNETDENANGVKDSLERFVFGSLQGNLDLRDQNVNSVPDWWELFYFGELLTAGGDADGDGLNDVDEWAILTDPTKIDTDGDGLSDGFEVSQGDLDPHKPDADKADVDGDGLPKMLEQQYGTSDQNSDSDGDNINDGDEVAAGSDPLDVQSRPFDPGFLAGADLSNTGCENIGRLDFLYSPVSRRDYTIEAGLYQQLASTIEEEKARATWQLRLPGARSPLLEFSMEEVQTSTYSRFRSSGSSILEAQLVRKEEPRAIGLTGDEDHIPITCQELLLSPSTGEEEVVDFCFNLRAKNHLTIDLEEVIDGDVVTSALDKPLYLVPYRQQAWSFSNSGGEAVGARYRKIALNGRPMADTPPEGEAESDTHRELSYVDALSLDLHHDTSFVSVPIAASDLNLEISASVNETTWNNRSSLRPHEQLTLPFGVGWTSSICSYIEMIDTRGGGNERTVVNVVDEGGRGQRFGVTNGGRTFFPWPSSRVDAKTYLNTLTREGDKLVLRKKYGNTLTYGACDAWFLYSADRVSGSNRVRRHSYWRLEKVTDRYGNALDYDYGGSSISLIPQVISSAARGDQGNGQAVPQQAIVIGRSSDCRRVEWIQDPRGNRTTFNYTTREFNGSAISPFEYSTLDSVSYADGTQVRYGYEVVEDVETSEGGTIFHYHANLKTITDKRGSSNSNSYTHTFHYDFNRRQMTYSSSGGRLIFGANINQLPAPAAEFAAEWLEQQNGNFNSGFPQYETVKGLPRIVTQIDLPDGIGSSFFEKTDETELRFGPEFSARSGTKVTDALGNKTHYDFGGMEGERIRTNRSFQGGASSNVESVSFNVEWMVYYTKLSVHYGGEPTDAEYLGSEHLEFDLDSGLSLCALTDFSGNKTKWAYGEKLPGGSVLSARGKPNLMSAWADPTQKTDALGRIETYGYSPFFRTMDQRVDVYDTTHDYVVDALGRHTMLTVTGSDDALLRREAYLYEDERFPAFMTRKTIEVFESRSGQDWEVPLVSKYEADALGRVFREIQDPDGLALTTEYLYDLNNNKTSIKDPRENSTIFAYDKLNRLIKVTYPVAGTSTGDRVSSKQIFYDFNGNKAAEIDEEGNHKIYHYDALNRLTKVIVDMDGAGLPLPGAAGQATEGLIRDNQRGTASAADLVTSTGYNSVSSVLTVTDPRGVVTRNRYDVMQRLTDVYGNWESGDSSSIRSQSNEKTHTKYEYLQQVTVDGSSLKANPGATVLAGGGFKPTRVTRFDAVQSSESGPASTMVDYFIFDQMYRPIRSEKQFGTTGANFDANFQGAQHAFGLISRGKEALTSTTTDDRGNITRTVKDGLLRVTSVTEAVGSPVEATTQTEYSSTGLAWKVTDAEQRESETEFDAVGRSVCVWAPDPVTGLVNRDHPESEVLGSPHTLTEYDANSNVLKTTNPRGNTWNFAYDRRNRKVSEKGPEVVDSADPTAPLKRPEVVTSYNGVGSVLSVTDAREHIVRTVYDKAYRPEYALSNPVTGDPSEDPQQLNAHDIVIQSVFDHNGNILNVTDGNENQTFNRYDALNRLVVTAVDPTDGLPEDPNGEGYTVGAASDIVVRNAYDDASNLIQVTDGENQLTAFRYDGLGRKTYTIWDPGTDVVRVELCSFDGLVKLSRTDPKDQVTTYNYDAQNRLKTITYTGRSKDDRAYAYDLVDNLRTVSYPNETAENQIIRGVSMNYDKLNRLMNETSAGRTHAYLYDKAGNRTETTYGVTNRKLVCDYDNLNRLEECRETSGGGSDTTQRTTTYDYDLNGNVVSKTLPNQNVTRCSYDALNRKLTKNTLTSSGGMVVAFDYSVGVGSYPSSYDNVGNVLRIAEQYGDPAMGDRVVVNSYDHVYRLDLEDTTTGNNVVSSDFEYDKANNRESKTVTENGTVTSTQTSTYGTTSDGYNSNQLKSVSESNRLVEFDYDANGNRTSKQVDGAEVQGNAYDFENRLVSVMAGPEAFSYAYDHRTRRVLRDESAAGDKATTISFSGGVSVQEIENDLTTVEYIRGSDYGGGIGGVLYTVRENVRSFNAYNSRGDVVSQTREDETFKWQASYEAYGTRTSESGQNQERQKANTKDEDPTGLLNEGMRYRDLEFGVFITRDPAGFVDGPNVYTYVRQNPWTFFDPLGLEAESITLKEHLDRVREEGSNYDGGYRDIKRIKLSSDEANGIIEHYGGEPMTAESWEGSWRPQPDEWQHKGYWEGVRQKAGLGADATNAQLIGAASARANQAMAKRLLFKHTGGRDAKRFKAMVALYELASLSTLPLSIANPSSASTALATKPARTSTNFARVGQKNIDDLVSDPAAFGGRSPAEVMRMLDDAGYSYTTRATTGSVKTGTVIDIQGKGPGAMQHLRFHPGGGRHKGSYWTLSGSSGKTQVVGPKYVPMKGQKAKTIQGHFSND